jgi:hypothetical protein
MTHELMLFAAAFATVFSLGFQQQNVLWRFVPDASPSQIGATPMGGPLGIVASMVAHRRYMKRGAA